MVQFPGGEVHAPSFSIVSELIFPTSQRSSQNLRLQCPGESKIASDFEPGDGLV